MLLGIVTFLAFLSTPALAQNTKGDRAEVSGGPRKSRFTGGKNRKRSTAKNTFNRRISPNRFSVSRAARSFTRSRQHSSSGKNVYSQKSFWVNNHNRQPSSESSQQGTTRYSRKAVKSPANKSRNVYPQFGRYVSNASRKPRDTQRAASTRFSVVAGNVGPRRTSEPPPGKKRKVVPRSASRSFIRHRTINANAGFWNVKKKGEVAVTTDIAGKPLRTKNYQTPTPGVIKPKLPASLKHKRVGDRPYRGPATGRYVSASRPGKAWSGDVAGRRIRGRNYTSKPVIEVVGNTIFQRKKVRAKRGDQVYRGRMPGNGYRSRTQPGEKRTGLIPLPGRAPGIGANGIGGFKGNLKGQRPLKGGGSRSGRLWNNNGQAVLGRAPGIGANRVGTFQGNLKGHRVEKGGGSRSGRLWNNNGNAIIGRAPGIGANRVGTFQGNIKAHRSEKGGGSRSGRLWNNNGTAINGRAPGIGANRIGTFQGNIKRNRQSGLNDQGEEFTGFIRSHKPSKGRVNVSGFPGNIKRFQQSPGFNNQGEGFTGFTRAHKPLKGGGSVSGKLWNNRQTPLPVMNQNNNAARVGGFPGNIKRFQQSPGFNNQGEEFTGFIRAHKPLKGGGSVSGKLWNNREKPIMKKDPSLQFIKSGQWRGDDKRYEVTPGFNNQGEEFTGFIKLPIYRRNYLHNKNTAEEALKKKRPDKSTYAVSNLQVKVKRRKYVENKNAADEALRKLAPTEATKAVANLQVTVKQYNYIHNGSSAKEALKVREPGKAFARATDYQGNIKMKKIDIKELFAQRNRTLHPDAKFVKIEKNNVASERNLMTNIKLWWAKTFRKNDTQPENLKDRGHKPRYDKGEQGLWND